MYCSLGLEKGKIVTRNHYLSLPKPSPRRKEPVFLRIFCFPLSKLSLSEKKEERTKDSTSVATNSSQRAVILMENPLTLVTSKLLPAGHLKPLLLFLVLNFIKFYFWFDICLFFFLSYTKQSFRRNDTI